MVKNSTKKIIAIVLLILTLLPVCANTVLASTRLSSALIKDGGDCGYHLQFWDTNKNQWSYVKTTYVYYEEGGKQYPAYCLQSNLPGVGSEPEYNVDIDSFIEDVRLWRVAINGYPYQTPQSMGLENYLDAFVATKQAIYRIIDGKDPATFYNGPDSRGQAIKNAIIKLVDIGKNGSQTPVNTDVTTNKIGGFIEDGDYYMQEYSISAPVETSQYTITATNGLPAGSKITNMSNNEQNTFRGNEHFKVRIPKTELTRDLDVTIALQAKCKTYPVFYGKTTVPGTQDYLLTFDPYGDVTGQAKLNIKGNTGKIKILKNDVDTKKPIEGVTFQLQKTDGTIIANATTNKNGEATFPNLYQGNYVLKEISTNDNYILSDIKFDVNVEYNKTTSKEITNEHKKGDLVVYKIDKDNHKIALGGVVFDLYSEEFKKVIGTYTTDENGEIHVKDLRTGNYKWIEKETNKWYNLAPDTKTEVIWDKETTNTIENELKKGQIKVIKVDKDNKEVRLEGVEFEVLDSNKNVLEKIITNENGEALTSRYPIRDFNKLTLREAKTKEEYVLNEEMKTIELKENQIQNVIFENERIKGKVEITKVDSKDESKKLEGAKFGLYDENNKLIETLITDKDGKAISKELYKGKYYLKELDTGSVYYLLNENTFEFEIINHGETIPVVIDNEPTDITVDVDKEGTIEIKPCEKVDYTFSNIANNSNVYLENFKWYDYIPTDYVRLEKMTTGIWNQDLKYDVYYKTNKSNDYKLFKENLSTLEDYELDFTKEGFSEDEYIVETCFEFGKVDKGFREVKSPTMQCKSLDTLQDGTTFTNHTKTVGIYYGVTAEANSKWTTIVHIPKKPITPILPQTGR